MDSMLVTITLILFAVAPLIQSSFDRLLVASVYIYGNVLMHETLFSSLDGLAYYGSAALADLFTIMILTSVIVSTELCGKMISICIISILLNICGWAIWFSEADPTAYNLSFAVLNAYTIYLLISGDKRHGRLGADGGRGSIVWCYLNNSYKQITGL